ETIVHLLHHLQKTHHDLLDALRIAVTQLKGAYGLALISVKQPERIFAARSGSPLVIGLGIGENFLASDPLALRQVTDRFIYFEEAAIAMIQRDQLQIWPPPATPVARAICHCHEQA